MLLTVYICYRLTVNIISHTPCNKNLFWHHIYSLFSLRFFLYILTSTIKLIRSLGDAFLDALASLAFKLSVSE